MPVSVEGEGPSLEPGYEPVNQRLFFRKEFIEKVHWFIRVGWVAAGGALAGAWVLRLLEPRFPLLLLPFSAIALIIFLYNLIFRAACRRLDVSRGRAVRGFTAFAHVQISLDLLALYGMIYFTGGVYSPLLLFVIFHIIIAGLLLTPLACYLYSFSSLLAPRQRSG